MIIIYTTTTTLSTPNLAHVSIHWLRSGPKGPDDGRKEGGSSFFY